MICLVRSKTVAFPFSGTSSIQAAHFSPQCLLSLPRTPWTPITLLTMLTGCLSQGVPGRQARGKIYPVLVKATTHGREKMPSPAVPTKSTRWDSGVPGPDFALPLLCCVTLGKQCILSEPLISSLENQEFRPCDLRCLPAKPLILLDPSRRRRTVRAGFPTGALI